MGLPEGESGRAAPGAPGAAGRAGGAPGGRPAGAGGRAPGGDETGRVPGGAGRAGGAAGLPARATGAAGLAVRRSCSRLRWLEMTRCSWCSPSLTLASSAGAAEAAWGDDRRLGWRGGRGHRDLGRSLGGLRDRLGRGRLDRSGCRGALGLGRGRCRLGDRGRCCGRRLDLGFGRRLDLGDGRDLTLGGGGRCRVVGGRRGGLLGALASRLGRLFGLDVALQTLPLGLAAHPVGLSFLDARGVALDTDAEGDAEVECLLVGEAELLGELMDSDLSCHVRGQPFIGRVPPPGHGPGTDKSLRFSYSFPNSALRRSRTASAPTGARKARSKARRFSARSTHPGCPWQSQAPRPGAVRLTTSCPSRLRAIRTSST